MNISIFTRNLNCVSFARNIYVKKIFKCGEIHNKVHHGDHCIYRTNKPTGSQLIPQKEALENAPVNDTCKNRAPS